MKRLILLSLALLPTVAFAPSYNERMSVQDLYYKLLRESELVRQDEERAAQEKAKKEREKRFRRHQIQRVGPDPAPEDDLTIDQPEEENVLEKPYKDSDALEQPNARDSILDDPIDD